MRHEEPSLSLAWLVSSEDLGLGVDLMLVVPDKHLDSGQPPVHESERYLTIGSYPLFRLYVPQSQLLCFK